MLTLIHSRGLTFIEGRLYLVAVGRLQMISQKCNLTNFFLLIWYRHFARLGWLPQQSKYMLNSMNCIFISLRRCYKKSMPSLKRGRPGIRGMLLASPVVILIPGTCTRPPLHPLIAPLISLENMLKPIIVIYLQKECVWYVYTTRHLRRIKCSSSLDDDNEQGFLLGPDAFLAEN